MKLTNAITAFGCHGKILYTSQGAHGRHGGENAEVKYRAHPHPMTGKRDNDSDAAYVTSTEVYS